MGAVVCAVAVCMCDTIKDLHEAPLLRTHITVMRAHTHTHDPTHGPTCMTGPTATAPLACCTALYVLLPARGGGVCVRVCVCVGGGGHVALH